MVETNLDAYHIVFGQGVPDDWAQAAEVLSRATGINKIETTKACKKGFGLVLLPMEREQAEAGAAALIVAGFSAKRISAQQLVKAPAATTVTQVAVENGLMLCLPTMGDWLQLPLAAVRIVYAGYLLPSKQKNEKEAMAEIALKLGSRQDTEEASGLATGLAVGAAALGGVGVAGMMGAKYLAQSTDPRNLPAVAKVPRTPEPCIDFICVSPLTRVRVMQRRYNYQTLGPRLMPNMRGNFKQVVNDLLAAVPHATQLGRVQEAARGGNLEQEKFIQEDSDVSLELTALLTRMAQFPQSEPRP